MIKGIIFDYGGTIDTDGMHWAEIIWNAYKAIGVNVNYEHYRMAYVHGERSLARFPLIKQEDNFLNLLTKKINLQTAFLVDAHLWTEMEKREDERKDLSNQIAKFCYDFVLQNLKISRPVIEELARQFPLVLVSNFYGNINTILEDFKLNLFQSVIESAVVGVRKPNPKIFQLGVDALNFKTNEVIVVGDSYEKDIKPANSIGCKTVWIKGTQWDKNAKFDEALPNQIISTIKFLKQAVNDILLAENN